MSKRELKYGGVCDGAGCCGGNIVPRLEGTVGITDNTKKKKKKLRKGKRFVQRTEMNFKDTDVQLFKVLDDAGNIKGFLDRVFGFLFRCTDFYRTNKVAVDPLGLPKDSPNELLKEVFENWKRADSNEAYSERKEKKKSVREGTKRPPGQPEDDKGAENRTNSPLVEADIYNGAQCDGYRWAQTHVDLDVHVAVDAEILSARNVNVEITSTSMCVNVGNGDNKRTLVEGNFQHEIRPADTVWTLLPGQYIHVVLEKKTARWWDALLTHEFPLDVTKLHRTRSLGDLPEAERDAVIALMEKQTR